MQKFIFISNDEHKRNELTKQLDCVDCIVWDEQTTTINKWVNDDMCTIIDVELLPAIHGIGSVIDEFSRRKKEIIGVSSKSSISEIDKKNIVQYGITAVFPLSQCRYIPPYCDKYQGLVSGIIGIVDNNIFHCQGLSTLIKKFGYDAIVMNDLKDCCSADNSMDILCINCSQVSTHEIAAMYIGGKLPKKNAMVLYKSHEDDIFIHDILKLNRIVKVIYTLEEVYAVLLQLLFRQQFHALVYSLYESSDMQSSATSYRGNLRQWYWEAGMDIFTMADVLQPELVSTYQKHIQLMHALMTRAMAFQWMR